MFRRILFAFLYISLISPNLFAAEEENIDLGEIIITPLRTESEKEYQEIHLKIIDNSEIENKNLFTTSDALSLIEGVDIVGGGRLGSASGGVYIRGAQPRHTAYMFEGLKIYDPSNTSAYYVPSDFLISGIEKIEIVKFPLSSLYGSSPIGGVINFMVKKPQEKPYVYLNSMGGSHDTQQESLELGGKLNNFSYLFNIIRLDTKGISKAKEKNNNPENDPYQDTNIILGLNYSDVDTEAGLAIKGVHSRMELDDDDNVDGIPEDDLDNMSWNNEFFNTVYFTRTLNSYLKYRAQAGFTSIYRKNRDDNSSGTDEYTRSWYRGETYQAGNHFEFIPFDYYKLIGGFDYTKEKMDSYSYTFDYSYMFGYESDTPKTSMHTKGWFVEQVLTPQDKLEIDFSYRREKHPLFKYHSVVKGGAVYSLSQNLNLYFSYGEGFKAPSLYQLFSANGNSSLTPEKSKTWETGITHKLFDYLSYSASYFHSDFKNLIDFVYTNPSLYQGKYLNAAKAKARGVELKINIEPIKPLSLEAGYSYLNGKQDFVDDDYVTIFRHSSIRVPKHKAFLKGDWKIGNLTTHFDLLYVDKRTDRIWVGASDEFVTMKSYILGNLSFSYLLKNDIYLFANINNILDKDYERIKGYQEERTSFYAGVRCKF